MGYFQGHRIRSYEFQESRMTRTRTLPILLGCTFVAGCASPFEGTWLFEVTHEPVDIQGRCEGWGEAYTYEDTLVMFVDIYTPSYGKVEVLFDALLEGESQGRSFEASYWSKTTSETEYVIFEVLMVAERDGPELVGTVQEYFQVLWPDDSWDCQNDFEFTAERLNM